MPCIPSDVIISQVECGSEPLCSSIEEEELHLEQQQIIEKEVDKLLMVGFIQEAYYSEWIANIVMVKKMNGKWRIYIDFTDLNKTCPKDRYSLSSIHQQVDATSRH